MAENFSNQNKNLNNDDTAFSFMDTSKVHTESTITIGVVHYILRPDEWLILRNIDWLQGLISAIFGAWIIGFISIIMKLLIDNYSSNKIQESDITELWVTLAIFGLWSIVNMIYKGRYNQEFKMTYVDRQALVDDIDSKLRLKYKRNEH